MSETTLIGYQDEDLATNCIEYINGKWFTGVRFEDGARWVEGGLFVQSPRSDARGVKIDLKGWFVVPPFGDAHSHHPEQHFRESNEAFLNSGIYYVLNANDIASYSNETRSSCFTPNSIDVYFAHAGFTSPNGHPADLYAHLIARGVYPQFRGGLEGHAYFEVATPHEVQAKWLRHLETDPDLVKLYVLDWTGPNSSSGLTAACLQELCRLARARSIRVAAHIETADDFRVCVSAGANLIMHLPGYRRLQGRSEMDYQLALSDAHAAASHGVGVVTTAALLDGTRFPELVAIQRTNLGVLRDAHVRIGIGSDRGPGAGFRREVEYLRSLELFDNLDLLRMICVETPRLIFPDRQLAILSPGYEASFLALTCNPLEEITALFDIQLRVKCGFPLSGTHLPYSGLHQKLKKA